MKVKANLEGEELYTSNIHPYFRAPHLYVGPATRYMANQEPNTCVIFMSSRDGVQFDRTFGAEVFKETVPGNRTNYLAWTNGAQTGPRELSFYDHQGNRYTLRLDGFASVKAGKDSGAILTKPLRFAGKQLHVNAAAKGGTLRVEVQNAAGKAIPGFTLDDSLPLTGDEIDHAMLWEGGRDVSAPFAGQAGADHPDRVRRLRGHRHVERLDHPVRRGVAASDAASGHAPWFHREMVAGQSAGPTRNRYRMRMATNTVSACRARAPEHVGIAVPHDDGNGRATDALDGCGQRRLLVPGRVDSLLHQ